MIASAVTISTINDLVGDDSDSTSDVERRYRGVAGWLVFLGVAGLIFEIIMAIFRGLYFGQVLSEGFVVFGVVVSFS